MDKELNKIKNTLYSYINEDTITELIQGIDDPNLAMQMLNEAMAELIEDTNPWKWEMVSPEEFLTNPYYCGVDPKTGIGVATTMYPKLREDFIKIHDRKGEYRNLQEVVLTGSIGWGKSFFMEMGILWNLYLLSCLKSPQSYYGLERGSRIGIIIISVTEQQGLKNIFTVVKDMIGRIPYFQERFMYNKKKATESLLFPNNIEIFPASSSHSSNIGLHIFSAALDEANFFKKVKNSARSESGSGIFDAARTLYRSLRRRLDSRFAKYDKLPGIFYIGSSRVYPNDFTSEIIVELEERNKAALERGELKYAYIMDYNQWEVNRGAYSEEEFQVEIGELNRRSRILQHYDTPVGRVINVPMSFYDSFVADIDNAIRDIAGYGIHAIQPFIGDKDKIFQLFENNLDEIFSKNTVTLSPKTEYLQSEYITKRNENRTVPRYIAIDIGINNDRFGFAMGYISGYNYIEREYFDNETQQLKTIKERQPTCVVELVLEIIPEEEFGEVELARVRWLIYKLIKYGYNIRRCSTDGFQSKDMQQQLKRQGIKVEYISMDKTPEPYETFRTALYDGRIECIYHPKLELELNELERNYGRNKIDHPAMGSKDLSDAVGSMVHNMHIDPIYSSLDLLEATSMLDEVSKPDDDPNSVESFMKELEELVKST